MTCMTLSGSDNDCCAILPEHFKMGIYYVGEEKISVNNDFTETPAELNKIL